MSLVRWSERSRRAKVSPGTPGSTQSSSTRSGRVSRTSASACGTSPAHMTLYPARCKLAARRSRIAASSSTTRMEPPMASPVVSKWRRCYVASKRRTIAAPLFNSRVILAACRFAPTRGRHYKRVKKTWRDPCARPVMGKARILVVDDRRANLIALEAVLGADYEMLFAESGEEALAVMRSRQDVDLILMDVQMPDMDGFETAERIKQMDQVREIPIIFVTAIYTEDPFIRKGYQVGGIDYFSKPFDPEI